LRSPFQVLPSGSSTLHFEAETSGQQPRIDTGLGLAQYLFAFQVIDVRPRNLKSRIEFFSADEIAINRITIIENRVGGNILVDCAGSDDVYNQVVFSPSLIGLENLSSMRRWSLTGTCYTFSWVRDLDVEVRSEVQDITGRLMLAGAASASKPYRFWVSEGSARLSALRLLFAKGAITLTDIGDAALTDAGLQSMVVARMASASRKVFRTKPGIPDATWSTWQLLVHMETGWSEHSPSRLIKATPFVGGDVKVWWSRALAANGDRRRSIAVSKQYLLALLAFDHHGKAVPPFQADKYYIALLEGRDPPLKSSRKRGLVFGAEGSVIAPQPRPRKARRVCRRAGLRRDGDPLDDDIGDGLGGLEDELDAALLDASSGASDDDDDESESEDEDLPPADEVAADGGDGPVPADDGCPSGSGSSNSSSSSSSSSGAERLRSASDTIRWGLFTQPFKLTPKRNPLGFEAECFNPLHRIGGQRCRRTTTYSAEAPASKERVIAYLKGWLLHGLDPNVDTKKKHMDAMLFPYLRPTTVVEEELVLNERLPGADFDWASVAAAAIVADVPALP
jgi:hypothetical protein